VLAIVRGATAMVFPSRYEGFGLPVLEAMGLGTPVLSSVAGALPEVVGDAAVKLPVEDAAAWVEAMLRILEDDEQRARLVEAGRKRVAEFTWARTADATLGTYRAVLGDGAAPPPPPDDAPRGPEGARDDGALP